MARKGGSGLAVFSLIIGLIAVGIGGYNFYIQIRSDGDEIGNTWYKSEPDFFTVMPANTYVTFNDLTIQFNINSGESVYICYTSYIFMRLNSPDTGPTSIEIYYSLDGQRLESPHVKAQDYYDGSTYLRFPASLQYFNTSLTPGDHNVTIVLYGSFNINGVLESTLFVQTFPS
jgi:hypothetical protein